MAAWKPSVRRAKFGLLIALPLLVITYMLSVILIRIIDNPGYQRTSERDTETPHCGHPKPLKAGSLLSLMLSNETPSFCQQCWQANHSLPERTFQEHAALPFLIGSPESPACRGRVFLLLAVLSYVRNRDRRELIRQTWGSVANIQGDRLVTLFFVGRPANSSDGDTLVAESDSRADVVQGDFLDTYRNLTLKHLYALRWIGERCQSVRFVMKLDDDVVVNVFRLRSVLRDQMAKVQGDFFYCKIERGWPHRHRESKWMVTRAEWPDDWYPEYCLGGYGYVMSGSLIPRLHHCAKWRRYFWLEDVFVSGALASALGVPRIPWDDGWTMCADQKLGEVTGQLRSVIAVHRVTSPELQTKVWGAMVGTKWC